MTAPVCQTSDCGAPAAARVSVVQPVEYTAPGIGFAMVRPAATSAFIGVLMCAECTHRAVDVMLLRAMPGASR